MSTNWAARRIGLRADRRGLSTVVAAIVVVIVLVLMGVATYGVLGGFSKASNPTTCWPPTAFVCGQFIDLHDVTLVVPFKSVQQGADAPFTVQLPPSESATSYTVNFGDGTAPVTSSQSTLTHNFTSPGVYLVEAQATVNGLVHDNVPALTLVTVTPSFGSATAGNLPGVLATLVSNTTAPAGSPSVTAVLQPFQSVTVGASYSSSPTNPDFTPLAPSFNNSGGVKPTAQNLTSSSGTETVSFATPGTYQISFVASASDGNSTLYQNFTWSVFVAPTGEHAGVAGTQIHVSPHPGTIINYELAPGGAFSEDPAIDYETVGAEPIYNVYQTLINYNGSLTGPTADDFVPQLATCVPGSAECVSLYSNNLVTGNNYTFVIQPNASFYDPSTQAHWGVWPTDVVFSIARTLGFSTLPSVSINPGWIIAQSLLNSGNYTWDSIHGSYNNTPQQILGAMTINGSDCPSAAMNPSTGHGCVTFNVDGNHHDWPYFLELIADPLGGAIVSCGWFSASAQGAGIPYWTAGNSSGAGDHPCAEPGTAGYGRTVPNIPYTGWDEWEQLGSGAFGTYQGHVQFGMLGSGPYYMQQYSVGISYTLQANPYYGQNPDCTWTGCEPAAGNFATNVQVTWETTATPGEQAYAAGIADHASVPEPDLDLLLQLVGQGKVNLISAPTLTIGFEPFDLSFNTEGAQKFTTNPITVPTDWFSYMGMRQMFARDYPYGTVQQTINTRDGIQFAFNYGGAIPQFMANYYPRNIAWPSTDPCQTSTDTACPSYWWAQMHNPASPYYDPEVLTCTSTNPCQLPMFGTTGNPTNDQIMALWAGEVASSTANEVKVTPVDINFVDVIVNAEFSGPGQNPMPMYALGWAPDYPDPTDYVNPLYAANGTYTYGDSVMESLLTPQFTDGCPASETNYNYFANTTFGNDCQGVAYKAMLYLLGIAASTPPGNLRTMQYDEAEEIAYQLGLYAYTGQSNEVAGFASWIDTNSINTNVTIGGAGDIPYYWLTGNGVQHPGST
jgi:peptide/nickel transport system substrate-binding protein